MISSRIDSNRKDLVTLELHQMLIASSANIVLPVSGVSDSNAYAPFYSQ